MGIHVPVKISERERVKLGRQAFLKTECCMMWEKTAGALLQRDVVFYWLGLSITQNTIGYF